MFSFKVNMTSKVSIVTGSNKGLGYAIVQELCKKNNGTVYLTSRDEHKGREACDKLAKLNLKPSYHQLDITDQQSVIKCRDHIKNEHGNIDILINNAGILFLKDSPETRLYQAEQTVFVNFTSLVDFTEVLIPLIRDGGRIINISSSSGHLSRIPSDTLKNRFSSETLTLGELKELVNEYLEAVENKSDIQLGWGNSPYVVSKVAVNAYTFILHRRLRGRGILVNCVHPGYVISDMTNGVGSLTPDDATKWPIYLATEVKDSGLYMWHNGKVVPWNGQDPRIYIDGKDV